MTDSEEKEYAAEVAMHAGDVICNVVDYIKVNSQNNREKVKVSLVHLVLRWLS